MDNVWHPCHTHIFETWVNPLEAGSVKEEAILNSSTQAVCHLHKPFDW